MSWSVENKCFHCSHYIDCVDATLINSAISDIHYLGAERGHLGGGVMAMDCQNFDRKEEEKEKHDPS